MTLVAPRTRQSTFMQTKTYFLSDKKLPLGLFGVYDPALFFLEADNELIVLRCRHHFFQVLSVLVGRKQFAIHAVGHSGMLPDAAAELLIRDAKPGLIRREVLVESVHDGLHFLKILAA